jgi:hypothetical protein
MRDPWKYFNLQYNHNQMKQQILLSLVCLPLFLFAQTDSTSINYKLIAQISPSESSGKKADTSNIAWIIIECELNNIESRLHGLDSSVKYQYAVRMLELLSGIISESDAGFAGKMEPSVNEYKAWKNWFELNKHYIAYDSQKKLLVFSKPIAPLLFTVSKNYGLNNKALHVISEQLKIISDFVYKKNTNKSGGAGEAIHFLTALTGIGSESDGNIAGQCCPTKNDYDKWSKWYANNIKYLFADENKRLIFYTRQAKHP